MSRRAFSLVELAICVAIILIVAAIAIPVIMADRKTDQVAPLKAQTAPGRFTVEAHGAFACSEPDRESKRAIYIITDTETGERYLAAQGCGTTQLVTERHGKTNVKVER